MPVRASILIVLLVAAATAATALLRSAPVAAPAGLDAAARDGALDPRVDAPAATRSERTERAAVPPAAEPEADCCVRGRFVVPADVAPGSVSWTIQADDPFFRVVSPDGWFDESRERPPQAADGYSFASRGLRPGTHRLGAVWRAAGPRLAVVVREVELAPGQDLDLGAVAPEASSPARLRIEPRLLPGRRMLAPQELADAGFLGPIDLRIALGPQQMVLGRVEVPVDTDVAVHGLPVAGVFVHIANVPRLRIHVGGTELALVPRPEPQHLVPGGFVELMLDYAVRCELTVQVTSPSAGAGWIELHVIDLPDGKSLWQRWATAEGSTRTATLLAGQKLLVASLVDREGATCAFAMQRLELGAPRQVVALELQRALVARGTWDRVEPGRQLQIALQEWPQHPLWRATTGQGGSFTVPGLPSDQALVAVDGKRVQRVVVQRADDELLLTIAR
jgi:hypothetical protein